MKESNYVHVYKVNVQHVCYSVTDLGGNTSCVVLLTSKPVLCNTYTLEHPVQGH